MQSWAKRKVWVFLICFFSILTAQELPNQEIEFLRIQDGALQTAIYTMSHPSGIKLKIIGMIHVGEASYYKNILQITKDMDFIFYEGIRMNHSLVTSPKTILLQTPLNSTKKGIQNISSFQNEFARHFDLVEQGEYLKPKENWVNADVKFSEFLGILRNLDISLEQLSQNLSMDTKVWLDQDTNLEDTITAQDSREIAVQKYKRKMARYLIRSARELCFEENMKVPREAIIVERNKIALTYLDEKLRAQGPGELGLIYGAAHLPHFVEAIQSNYNFTIEHVEWLDAWRLDNH